MSLSSYLASKYLSADPPSKSSSSRKRKRKQPESGLKIADDDALGWTTNHNSNEQDDTGPITITSGSAEFRKAKKNAWKTVGVPPLQPRDEDAAAADRIINEAAAENSAAMHADEGPVIEANGDIDMGVVKMGDGTHAGLQSGAAVAAQFAKRKKEELAAWEMEQASLGLSGKGRRNGEGEETVYRDATGRRIDISMRRQEARKEAEERERKEREEKEMQKGEVQLRMKENRRVQLDEARFMTVARGVDDRDMNEELKSVERWNDPAAQFMLKSGGGKGGNGVGKKVYSGAAAPNRYGIRPGHRWDGVDRGNGWEAERFKSLNRRERNKDLDYSWQMDE